MRVLHDAWLNGEVRLLTSPPVLKDVETALRKKKLNLPESQIAGLLSEYKSRCEMLTPPEEQRPGPAPQIPKCRDVKDQCYLELAYAAGADALVSGDKDLHAVAGEFSVPILTARDFLERFLPGRTTPPG